MIAEIIVVPENNFIFSIHSFILFFAYCSSDEKPTLNFQTAIKTRTYRIYVTLARVFFAVNFIYFLPIYIWFAYVFRAYNIIN